MISNEIVSNYDDTVARRIHVTLLSLTWSIMAGPYRLLHGPYRPGHIGGGPYRLEAITSNMRPTDERGRLMHGRPHAHPAGP